VYNPKTNRWSRTAPMRVGRAYHSAVRLVRGQVLVAGGTGDIFGGGLQSCEIYNPGTGRWIKAGTMRTVRTDEYWCCRHAVRLAGGKVLLAGGFSGARGRGAELFNPATRTWKATGRLRLAHDDGFLVRLRGSRVLLVGGGDDFGPLKYAELYHPATGRWSRVNDLRHNRYASAAVLLTNGQVLVTGGSTRTGARRSSELFTPR
jgi:N-acetylneuraminic acid mutarotase